MFSEKKHAGQIDDSIRKILASWFKKDGATKWWEKQSFFSADEVQQILKDKEEEGIKGESEVTQEQIEFVKKKCSDELEKEFNRENFYLTKDFIDQMEDPSKLKVDLFQEVALFCSVPTTAKDYVKDAMQGVSKKDFLDKDKTDYCYVADKSLTDYEKVSTIDPFGGKTFWCAVRLLYENKNQQNKSH
ncbi:hypothetical protein [Candidatus Mycoplasma haematohominis]|uniref:hypothetical protein n=1 Tax=Candidatus Mycoplasma haematohominis TaxID=1494318 RepID=UPI001C0A6A79|nr:hypothetical protein [Candidatus Mycoplasma haemohominis]